MTTNSGEPLKLLYCYAHEDKALRDELDAHLAIMKRQKLLEVWYDRQIMPGTKWEQVIDKNLTSAHIILLLVSAPFLNSDYCYGIEMQKALQRDAEGIARVVPIILRPVDWEDAPFSTLQVLPTGAKPVTRWADRDDAFEDIAKELRKVVKELRVALKPKELSISLKTKEGWLDEGIALYNLKRYEEALSAYEQAIRLDPTFGIAYTGKGNVLNTLERYEEALAAYEQAIRLNPNLVGVYNGKGNALYNLKRYEEALATLDRAIYVAPNYSLAYYNKGLVLQRLNRESEAQAAFKKARELGYSG